MSISTFALPVNQISQLLPMEPISTCPILLKFLTPALLGVLCTEAYL